VSEQANGFDLSERLLRVGLPVLRLLVSAWNDRCSSCSVDYGSRWTTDSLA